MPAPPPRSSAAPVPLLQPASGLAALLPPRPRAWQELLDRAPLVPVELVVSAVSANELLEQLSYPGQPTRALYYDGSIIEREGGLARAVRLVHLTRIEATLLHARQPLALIAYDGPACARLRAANAGQPRSDAVLAVLDSLRDPAP